MAVSSNLKVVAVYIVCFAVALRVTAQNSKVIRSDETTLDYTIEEANDWTNLLKRDSGWFGGDGIFTIPLNGVEHRTNTDCGSVLFVFSDSMIGRIQNNTVMPGAMMIHNSVAILQGNKPDQKKISFYWDITKAGKPESIFIPTTPKTKKGEYFWLGDGFVNTQLSNDLYLFGYRIKNVSDTAFGFKEVGNVLIRVPEHDKPPYKAQRQMDTPYYIERSDNSVGSFGAGIYVNTVAAGAPAPDGYIYIYGVVGKWKDVLVARVRPQDFDTFTKWTFWDGAIWNNDVNKATKVTNWVSNELSVTPLPDGRYAMIFQIGTMSKDIGVCVGTTPYGPFGPVVKIWDCSKDLTNKNYFVYNAKAHPSLSQPGELIISYNVNSRDFLKDLALDPNMYRPRFLRLKLR